MDFTIKVAVFFAGALALVALNIWFVRTVRQAFFVSSINVAPFEVAGESDKAEQKGAVLARMLIARLARIEQELEAVYSSLDNAGEIAATEGPTQSLSTRRPVELRILERPSDIRLSVQGVDLGPLFSWLQSFFAPDNVMHVSVQMENGKATIASDRDPAGGKGLWISDVGASNNAIVEALAYEITQRHTAARIPEVAALSRKEFTDLITALSYLAELNGRVASGRRTAASDFDQKAQDLERLTETAPAWWRLSFLTAETFSNAERPDKALAQYQRCLESMRSAKAADSDVQEVARRVAKLHEDLFELSGSPGEIASSESSKRILSLLGVDNVLMQRKPTMGVVGSLPLEGTLARESMEVLGGGTAGPRDSTEDRFLEEYMTTIVQTVQLVAPETRFLFAPNPGGLTTHSVVEQLDRFLEAHAEIVLITFTLDNAQAGANFWVAALRRLVDAGIVVVLSAGNEGNRPSFLEGKPILDEIILASAVDADGAPAPFSQSTPQATWAPGTQILTLIDGKKQFRSGTSYSGALAAAVAARVLDVHPGLTPSQTLELLRRTSKPARGRASPPILNLRSALLPGNDR